MTGLDTRVDGFKNSNPIPEPITCQYGGLSWILPAHERVR
ncbi:hypothetical protein A2U01_0111756, partial [Trifolium medium]|nr:hypothetical protein [Trifolium medium]